MRTLFMTILFLLFSVHSSALAGKTHFDVELHWLLCDLNTGQIWQKLVPTARLPKPEKQRHVSYYDQDTKSNYNAGMVLRLRTKSNGTRTSTVKLRLKSESDIQPKWFKEDDFKCEWDYYGSRQTLNCSFDAKPKAGEFLTSRQLAYIDEVAAPDVQLTELAEYGPALDSVWEIPTQVENADEFDFELERYVLKDGFTLHELSFRSSFQDRQKNYEKATDFIQRRGLLLCPVQESKTKTLLFRSSAS